MILYYYCWEGKGEGRSVTQPRTWLSRVTKVDKQCHLLLLVGGTLSAMFLQAKFSNVTSLGIKRKEIMAAANRLQRMLDDGCVLNQAKLSRMSFTSEYKLKVMKAYQGTNLYQTAKWFSLSKKTIICWVTDAESPMLVIVLMFNLVLSIL